MSVAEEIRKLNELREQGVISDAEFEQQKRLLLADAPAATARQSRPEDPANAPTLVWSDVKLKNKWWFQSLLTFVVPLVGLIFLFMKSYQKGRNGEAKRVGVWFKLFFVAAVTIVWMSILSRPQGDTDHVSGAANAVGATPDLLPACGSADARALINDAIINNAANNIATLRLLDVTEAQEISATDNERRCNATLFLNSGRERVGYRIFPSSDRSMILVEVGAPYVPSAPRPLSEPSASQAPAPEPASPPSDQSSNVDYDQVRRSNLTADQVVIVENVCRAASEDKLDQFSVEDLSYATFCIEGGPQ